MIGEHDDMGGVHGKGPSVVHAASHESILDGLKGGVEVCVPIFRRLGAGEIEDVDSLGSLRDDGLEGMSRVAPGVAGSAVVEVQELGEDGLASRTSSVQAPDDLTTILYRPGAIFDQVSLPRPELVQRGEVRPAVDLLLWVPPGALQARVALAAVPGASVFVSLCREVDAIEAISLL